jgi:hypothetical protein
VSLPPLTLPPALRARDAVYFALTDVLGDVELSRDAGSFHPAPLGVLVGLPALVSRTMAARTYAVSVHIVSADPLSSPDALDGLFALADVVVMVLGAASYTPADWAGGVNRDALPSVYIQAVVTVTEEGE